MKVIPPVTINTTGTFSRASTATYTGADGLLHTAAVDEPRFDYAPVTLAFQGLLVEAAATNLVLYSEQFDNAAWAKSVSVVSPDVVLAPDGTTTADKLVASASSAQHYAYQGVTKAAVATTYTFSVWAKPAGLNSFAIEMDDVATGAGFYAVVNVSTGAVVVVPTNFGAGWGAISVVVSQGPNGWYRVKLTGTSPATTGVRPFLVLAQDNGNQTFAGDGVSGINFWGAQLEASASATSYIKTTTGAATRAADVVTGTGLIYSTAAEPGAVETLWNAATAYTVGQQAIRTTTHRVYQRLVAGTTATAPEADTINWLDVGPTNKWAMFDLLRNSATTVASPLTVVINPGKRTNSLALVGMDADSVSVSMTVGASTVYTHTETLTLRNTTSWSEYFFGEFRYRRSLVLFDLPPYTGATITVTLTRTAGTVKCGGLVLGSALYMGDVEYGATSDALNFSTVTRDNFGNATLVQRRTVPKTTQRLVAPKAMVDKLREIRTDLNALPAIWSGLDDKNTDGYFEALLILGVYKEFTISADHPTECRVSLQLEEI